MIAAPDASFAQVGVADRFTTPTWSSVENQARPATARRSARRSAPTTSASSSIETEAAPVVRQRAARRNTVSSTTSLEDFEVPRQAARRASASPAQVVTRRVTQRRVRVAAVSRNTTDYIEITPSPRAAVKRVTRSSPASRSSRVSLRSLNAPLPSLTGGGIAWRANSGCLAGNLRSVMSVVAARFGAVTVNSTCRNVAHNRRVGGARKSWHLTGQAVDFRVRTASIGSLAGYLRSVAGGFKHYGGGRFHIDNGPKRSF